mmetsp:Transcript_48783/g.106040  ORF Transcript_48783/g.106040 Transcript_48783/m.106040 type:complete len:384 (+) Transcript_48783:41-1192(+)|eukprot:CAMPEP_0170583814 /NCGR_PEP_ID=MMETSP0224-20130122/8346_1 /TAXON_ID=285029 /ORGANISM="Togula jolla, Strain CCCM 725" /LENGTH=383 /DNA_ID=CAMNT_0010907187 /DNA_START=32 /DNA_END=1183 /DNA_ORIENTATION=-
MGRRVPDSESSAASGPSAAEHGTARVSFNHKSVATPTHYESREGPLAADYGSASGSAKSSMLAPALAGLMCILYCCNGELLQALQLQGGQASRVSPLLNLVFCHIGGLAFWPFLPNPPRAFEAVKAPSLPVASLLLSVLLMSYNYAWLLSARHIAVGLTNAIFQSSIAFVFLASVVLFGEPLTLLRSQGVILCLLGTTIASGFTGSADQVHPVGLVTGVPLALLASAGVTMYQVVFKYWFGHLKGDVGFLLRMGLWVSGWHAVLIFPLVVLASRLGFEQLEMPSDYLMLGGVLVSACVASAVNALSICIVMWGSPMLLPCASAVSVPMTVCLDALFHGEQPTAWEVFGHLCIVLSIPFILGVFPQPAEPQSLQAAKSSGAPLD